MATVKELTARNKELREELRATRVTLTATQKREDKLKKELQVANKNCRSAEDAVNRLNSAYTSTEEKFRVKQEQYRDLQESLAKAKSTTTQIALRVKQECAKPWWKRLSGKDIQARIFDLIYPNRQ